MTVEPTYVLDANVFIEAARRYYAFDLAPRFWESLVYHAGIRRIWTIDWVRRELERGKDELAAWVKNDFDHAIATTDEVDVIQAFSQVMTWVQGQSQFSDPAKAEFAKSADGWLVAFAAVKGYVVVTQEVAAPDSKRRVPIPNVCQAFNVPFVNTYEMLRELGVRFA